MYKIRESSSECLCYILVSSLKETHSQIFPPPLSSKINTVAKQAGIYRKGRRKFRTSLRAMYIGSLPELKQLTQLQYLPPLGNKKQRVASYKKQRYVLPQLSLQITVIYVTMGPVVLGVFIGRVKQSS